MHDYPRKGTPHAQGGGYSQGDSGTCQRGREHGITEKDVFEAMGLTVPPDEAGTQQEPTGANEPGAAAPAAEETNGARRRRYRHDGQARAAEGAVTAPEARTARKAQKTTTMRRARRRSRPPTSAELMRRRGRRAEQQAGGGRGAQGAEREDGRGVEGFFRKCGAQETRSRASPSRRRSPV